MAKHISKKKKKKKKTNTTVIPPEDSVDKSFFKEAQTSDILAHVSNMDANVIMGEDDSKKDEQGKPSHVTSETFVSFPPQITPIIPITSTTDSPTFENIIKHPFTSLFSSQSTDPPTTTSPIQASIFMETENEYEVFGGTFENLVFDEDEVDFPDHMLMTMNQFKILNTKLNSILQSQADLGGGEERKGDDAKAGGDDAKLVGKVFSSKIPTTKPIIATVAPITSTVVTILPITRPVLKGIVIGKSADIGGSDLKTKEVIEDTTLKSIGKTVVHQSIITTKQSKPSKGK
ncbi:unnamed protein product [Lactuca saligna]|uniref:Uncharacterized protein n=1 Tax=Lactuca saligna TaxID=75948 RepID=A0AA35ZUR7_LACSI|nr:unnamed protein product [Lactuca saligna]